MTNRLMFVLLAALLIGDLGYAAPVPDNERVPIDLRRTTLVVRDIDKSLALYRDALGMRVVYDNMLRSPRDAETDEAADRSSRLVLMQANDTFVGILGLLEYRKPHKPALHQGNEPFTPGSVVLVFNTENAETVFAAAKDTLGVSTAMPPTPRSYPSYDGEGKIDVMVSVLIDPDGFTIELNQLVSDIGR